MHDFYTENVEQVESCAKIASNKCLIMRATEIALTVTDRKELIDVILKMHTIMHKVAGLTFVCLIIV